MFSIIQQIINYSSSSGYNQDSYYLNICGALIIIFSVIFIDMVFRIFRSFWR